MSFTLDAMKDTRKGRREGRRKKEEDTVLVLRNLVTGGALGPGQ